MLWQLSGQLSLHATTRARAPQWKIPYEATKTLCAATKTRYSQIHKVKKIFTSPVKVTLIPGIPYYQVMRDTSLCSILLPKPLPPKKNIRQMHSK